MEEPQEAEEDDELVGEEDELDELAMEGPREGWGVGDVDNSEDQDSSRDTDDESNREDKDFQSAKRRKLPSLSANEILNPAREHNLKRYIGRPCRLTSPASMQIRTDDGEP
jgi:hypothetical protein